MSFRQVYVTSGIDTFQKDQQKAIDMFFEGNDVSVSLPTGYGKSIIYQAAPVIDRLSFLEETGHYIYCAASYSSHRRPGSLYVLRANVNMHQTNKQTNNHLLSYRYFLGVDISCCHSHTDKTQVPFIIL